MATKSRAFDPTKNSFASGLGQYNITTKNRPSSAIYNIRNEKELLIPSYKFGSIKIQDQNKTMQDMYQDLEIMNMMRIFFIKSIQNFLL